MKSFKQHITEQKLFEEFLEEKLIMLSNGANYGQIVFLAGGAGSGKGFAATNFMEKNKFKVRDVDEWKTTFMKIADLVDNPDKWMKMAEAGSKLDADDYKEIRGLNLKNSKDVAKLHFYIDKMGLKNKTMSAMLGQMKNKETLPNIMFDITAKDVKSIQKMMPNLLRAGYNPANIHLVWVLTDYQVAIKNNKGRERVVPDDIMLQTHKGAANTVYNLVRGAGKKLAINGAIHVILNNRENTVFMTDPSGKKKSRISDITGKKNDGVIKDFTYITLKERGKSMKKDGDVNRQLYQWIVDNIPEGDLQKSLEDQGMAEPKRRKKK